MAVSLRIWGNAKSPGPDASPGTPHAVPPGPRTFLSVISRACWKPSSAPNTPLKSGSWSQSGRFDTNSVTVPPGPVAAIPPRSGTRGAPAPAPPLPPRREGRRGRPSPPTSPRRLPRRKIWCGGPLRGRNADLDLHRCRCGAAELQSCRCPPIPFPFPGGGEAPAAPALLRPLRPRRATASGRRSPGGTSGGRCSPRRRSSTAPRPRTCSSSSAPTPATATSSRRSWRARPPPAPAESGAEAAAARRLRGGAEGQRVDLGGGRGPPLGPFISLM